MRVHVRFFAALAEIAGQRHVNLELPSGTSVAEVFEALSVAHPGLGAYRSRVLFAVNAAYADGEAVLQPGDEVALVPPVSGGAQCS